MCFSASASFGATAILSGIGVASLRQVKTPSEALFAGIPLIFAVQQLTEGILWLALKGAPDPASQSVTTYIFLFIAQVIWPVWVPFSIYKVEPNANRKKFLGVLTGLGLTVSLYLLFCLLSYHVEGKIAGHHISYQQDYPAVLGKYGGILYVISTIGPAFISSVRRMDYLGLSILISYGISAIFYEGYLVSVWCFFASIISALVYVVMRAIRNLPENNLAT